MECSAGTASNNRIFIIQLQGLRAIAFLCIFFSHTGYKFFSMFGAWGVSVFLILSGFLMVINHSGEDYKKISLWGNIRFAIRKVRKLYPLHILMMIVAIALELYARSDIKELLFNTVLNTALLQSFVPYMSVYYSLNAVSWYLSVMVFICFCFPWIHQSCSKIESTKTALIGIAALFLLQLLLGFMSCRIDVPAYIGFERWLVYVCPPTRLIDFFIGCILGCVYQKNKGKGSGNKASYYITDFIVLVCFLYTFVILSVLGLMQKEFWWSYSAIFTVANACVIYIIALDAQKRSFAAKVLSWQVMVWIGNMSASAFLVHMMAIRYVKVFTSGLTIDNAITRLTVKAFVPLALTVGFCTVWKKFEKRMVKLCYRK